ncbi:TPA: hypothetical protein DDW69_03505 [candidate division CPR2 bacterium]|uniref:Mannose-6-phosphate isomerase n=1 Tax=candidate division CPR2 bacterium GW2011_GWC1_41_48 TaxID=1618344 RepID=A0A0G0W7U6_UNCC2|nr:MAG: Mannose-6-phosphate isomerase [candidate division CPR2 bacterium GW2011_GWC2_39_35]KKR27780.1 MAG: Mannose-6-phosphate isomerase [candidate division CPR2 bacterium GW2011_GWD1_39_7]KKR28797.1 MAG: Mannose-6-phosphate isomerase [candidate division CPR2 bacterium GW2011_GWD2_39_7]KKS09045.1 MAG: Mannose-6-phosphate isomerase [candidate division CPR2 bacterium GW2011_GWC1_41_48]OGB59798.1 MAG: hypothetical protein A2Y27_00030 [candidate division CPR2 bacterium GWD1_39_7]OGB73157.1 MAG: hy
MFNFVKQKPELPTFTQKGLDGFQFPLENKELEVYYVDSHEGHDNFVVSQTILHVYYVLEGKGYFIINDKRFDVSTGMAVEIPVGAEFAYTGSMKMLLMITPPFSPEEVGETRSNLR